MNGRERLKAVLEHRAPGSLSWTTLVDDVTRAGMPAEIRKLSPFDFYRHIGCDILQFGNYGLSAEDAVPSPSRLTCTEMTCELETEKDGKLTRRQIPGANVTFGIGAETVTGRAVLKRKTPWGTLSTTLENDHPVEYPVRSLEDMRILRSIWEASDYVEQGDMEASFARTERLIGDDGMYVPTVDPSPVQSLLEYEMGVENFYYLFADYPDEMKSLLSAMHAKRLKEYEILARRSPAEVVISVENTSSAMISPDMYRALSLPQIRDYVDVLHAHGKRAVLHMCGHIRDLLEPIRETGLDGINAATPPPIGNTSGEDILDFFGDDFLLFGAVFDPSVLHKAGVSSAELHDYLTRLYTPRLRMANLVLWLAVDGLTTPLQKFLAVGQWMKDENLSVNETNQE